VLVPRFGAAERSSRKPLGANEWHREEAAERNPKRTGHPKRRVRRPSITRRGSSFVRTPTRAAESIHIAGRAIEIVRLYKAPAGALANDLKVDLKAHREELIRYLAASEGYGRQFDFALPDIEECREETPALSYLQRRLWFIDQLGEGSAQYTTPRAFKLTGRLRIEAFEQALRTIIERHEVLRTRIVTVEGEPFQRIEREFELSLVKIDLRPPGEAQRKMRVRELAEEDARRAFDLAGPRPGRPASSTRTCGSSAGLEGR